MTNTFVSRIFGIINKIENMYNDKNNTNENNEKLKHLSKIKEKIVSLINRKNTQEKS
jgi:C4-type Zn-finger protein